MKTLLITGAMGVIATKLLPGLAEKYELKLLDLRDIDANGQLHSNIIKADLLEDTRDHYRQHFRGVDAVIHSGFVRGKEGHEVFFAELDNVRMAYNVYQTCVEENVPRVVVVCSNHAADYYERLIRAGKMLAVTAEDKPLSDNYYGWAKISYEALGFLFATGNMTEGKKLENVQIRIGGPRETDLESCKPGDLKQMHRDLGAYLSLEDELQLFEKSIETENIEDENGVPFQIFYGVSNNSHNFWDIGNARRVIGYNPQDNSSERFSDLIRKIAEG